MTPERARQIAQACADSWYGGAAGMNLKEAIFQGIMEACKETEGDLVATRAERNSHQRVCIKALADLAAARAMLRDLRLQFIAEGDTVARIDAALAGKERA